MEENPYSNETDREKCKLFYSGSAQPLYFSLKELLLKSNNSNIVKNGYQTI